MGKVTGKDLEKLIEGALSERYEFKGSAPRFLDDLEIPTRKKNAIKSKVSKMKGLDPNPPDKFTASDIALGMTSDDRKARVAANVVSRDSTHAEFNADMSAAMSASGIKPPQDAEDFKVGSTKSIDLDSFSFPRPLGDLSSAGEGEFLGSQNELIRNIFTSMNLMERLEAIDMISDTFLGSLEELERFEPRELLQYTMMADLFDMFLNQVDQRAGGYMFETFLANLAGGSVVGGGNGIADFKSSDDSQGSAKLYNSWSEIGQSAKGFDDVGTSIHYVIAIHDAVKQAERRTNVKLFYVVVTLGSVRGDGSKVIIYSDGNGNEKNHQVISGNQKIDISGMVKPEDVYVGEFDLAGPTGDYKKKLNDLINAQRDGSKSTAANALKAMKGFFTSLYNAEENSKKYVAQSDATDTSLGDQALEEYDAADKFLQELLTLISPGKSIQGDRGKRKITQEHILKLIEESFKK